MTMRKAVFVMNSQGNILQGIVKDAKEFERSCQEQEGGKKKKKTGHFSPVLNVSWIKCAVGISNKN